MGLLPSCGTVEDAVPLIDGGAVEPSQSLWSWCAGGKGFQQDGKEGRSLDRRVHKFCLWIGVQQLAWRLEIRINRLLSWMHRDRDGTGDRYWDCCHLLAALLSSEVGCQALGIRHGPQMNVLEVGAGLGELAALLIAAGTVAPERYLATDLEEPRLQRALRARGLTTVRTARLKWGDDAPDTFDLCLSCECLYWTGDCEVGEHLAVTLASACTDGSLVVVASRDRGFGVPPPAFAQACTASGLTEPRVLSPDVVRAHRPEEHDPDRELFPRMFVMTMHRARA